MKIHMALVALIVLILASCATTNSLPSSSAEVDEFKKTEWPRKKRAKCVVLKGETVEQVFKIARTSLASNEFKILSEDLSQGILIGNHGMTWTYWNAVVGVYMTKIAEGVQVDVLAVSDADPRPIRLNKFDWNEKILKSIVSQSSSDSQACSK